MGVNQSDVSYQRYLYHQGRNYRSYEFLGAHPAEDPADGVWFRVWAPRAEKVAVVGDFNDWDPEADVLKQMEDDSSIWELLCSEARAGDLYKYVVTSDSGNEVYKADPYAFESEKGTVDEGHLMASRISDCAENFSWDDQEWLDHRDHENHYESPMNIYELHLGSWKHNPDGSVMNYRKIAQELIPYVERMGYTHIELLPVMEYPYEGSWGYQITGYYSVTSRYGTPEDFKYFMNYAHRHGIGVILDWVPAHFPKDQHGLIEFDGHPLYEDSDPLRMEHKGWGTRAFDFGRPEVLSFLISNAFFYCEEYHADGLRVDAVAAMLYLDYDREPGEWRPNKDGGNKNYEAIHFLQEMNRDVLTNYPGVITIAEESTAWPNVTKPPRDGGLGFNFKWNMGWMNDTLAYFSTDPIYRAGIHNKLTFSITYAYSENYILPISHDEVVHGKCSLLNKMPGEYDEKFDGLRSFYIYMMTHPGKKLVFMGQEIAQFIEWDEKKELDWMLLDYEKHHKMQAFVRELNHYYLDSPALWKRDDSFEGFIWIDADNAPDNVFTYMRTDGKTTAVIALNLSGRDFPVYNVGVPKAACALPKIDSDMVRFGGTGSRRKRSYPVKKGACNGYDQHIELSLPARSGIILELSDEKPALHHRSTKRTSSKAAAVKKTVSSGKTAAGTEKKASAAKKTTAAKKTSAGKKRSSGTGIKKSSAKESASAGEK